MGAPRTIIDTEQAAFRNTSPIATALAICNPDGSPISFSLNGAAITWNETPSGSIDGVNNVFTLNNTPGQGKIILMLNGLIQRLNTDFTLTGNTITFTPGNTPQIGDTLWSVYSV